MKAGCYKIEKRVIRTQVDLSHCDKRELDRAKSSFRSCEAPCQNYAWKEILSKVIKHRLLKKSNKFNKS